MNLNAKSINTDIILHALHTDNKKNSEAIEEIKEKKFLYDKKQSDNGYVFLTGLQPNVPINYLKFSPMQKDLSNFTIFVSNGNLFINTLTNGATEGIHHKTLEDGSIAIFGSDTVDVDIELSSDPTMISVIQKIVSSGEYTSLIFKANATGSVKGTNAVIQDSWIISSEDTPFKILLHIPANSGPISDIIKPQISVANIDYVKPDNRIITIDTGTPLAYATYIDYLNDKKYIATDNVIKYNGQYGIMRMLNTMIITDTTPRETSVNPGYLFAYKTGAFGGGAYIDNMQMNGTGIDRDRSNITETDADGFTRTIEVLDLKSNTGDNTVEGLNAQLAARPFVYMYTVQDPIFEPFSSSIHNKLNNIIQSSNMFISVIGAGGIEVGYNLVNEQLEQINGVSSSSDNSADYPITFYGGL